MNTIIPTENGNITINTQKQDYIRGGVLNVPDYDEWRQTHPYLPLKEGEHIIFTGDFYDKFQEIKQSLYIEGLPVTNISFTNQGRINLSYYHHTEDNMYILGYVFFDCTLEELAQLSEEEFKEFLLTNLVSSKLQLEEEEELINVDDYVYNFNKQNTDGEISEYRDKFLTAEKEYFLKLLEDREIYEMIIKLQDESPEELFEHVKKIELQLETGSLESEDELEYMKTLTPEARDEYHMHKLSSAEGTMSILLAAIGDKVLIKKLVKTYDSTKGRGR